MAAEHTIFPSQAYVDNLNSQLSPGKSFQVIDYLGDLVMNTKAVDSLLKNQNNLSPADVTAIEALPKILIEEQSDLDEARLVAIEDRLNLIEDRLNDLENP